MKKILVPVDGSKASRKAVEKAIELSNMYNSKLIFIHVVDTRGIYTYDVGGVLSFPLNHSKYTDDLIEAKSLFLDAFVASLEIENKEVEKVILHGEPSDRILSFAHDEEVDLIVMGRRGFSKIQRFFVGSVTQRVISDAPCPVLIINGEDE